MMPNYTIQKEIGHVPVSFFAVFTLFRSIPVHNGSVNKTQLFEMEGERKYVQTKKRNHSENNMRFGRRP